MTETGNNRDLILKIIWLSMILACGVYGVIAYVVKPQMLSAALQSMQMVLLGIATGSVLASTFVKGILLRKNAPGATFTAHIAAFALCESAALYGLILRMLGADWKIFFVLQGLAILGLLVNYPRDRMDQ